MTEDLSMDEPPGDLFAMNVILLSLASRGGTKRTVHVRSTVGTHNSTNVVEKHIAPDCDLLMPEMDKLVAITWSSDNRTAITFKRPVTTLPSTS